MSKKRQPRIGIYPGVFNPVHAGHITFALQAIDEAKLDKVVFLPERNPRHKPEVEHFAHRVAMLERALRPHLNMTVLELVDRQFTVQRTWPQLETIFAGSTLVVLMGSDAALRIPDWQRSDRMLKACELAVGVRDDYELDVTKHEVNSWATIPQSLRIFMSYAPDVSSSAIRAALREQRSTKGLLQSVQQYSRRNWLYISLGK